MPQAVAAWVAAKAAAIATSAGASAAVANTVAAIAYYGTQIAISAAVTAGAQALAGGTPDSETAKGSLKQPQPPRIRGYGRRRLGGSYLLWEAKGNKACDVIAWHSGRVVGPVEEIWLHDHVAPRTPGGFIVGSADYGGGDNNDMIHVETRIGLPVETPYAGIVALLGGSGVWTAAHRADGIATLGADYRHAKKENLLADYPNGDPKWGVTSPLSPVWDPRDPAQLRDNDVNHPASLNLALQIMDFCCRADGMAMDYETEIAPSLDHWKGEADICDEAIPLKAGGTEPRYWGSGYYALTDDPQNTLDKMLAACDGRLLRDEFGVWRLWVGKVRAPTIWLTDEDISDYDVQGDAAAFDAINELVPSFCSEAHKWTMVEATPWRNQPDIDLRGRVLTAAFVVEWANSASLVRRLCKRESSRQLTPLRGSLVGKLSCARALGQRWIGIDLPDLDLHQVVIEAEKGGKTAFSRAAVDIPFSLADLTVDEWDAETEEDGSGVAPDRPDVEVLDPPALTSATPFEDSLGAFNGVRLALIGLGPDRDDLSWYVRWRVAGDVSFMVAAVTDEAPGTPFVGESGFVSSAASLEVCIGYETGGSTLRWSDALTVDTRLAEAGPAMPSGLSAHLDGADLIVTFSITADHGRVFRGSATDDFEDAVDVSGELPAIPGVAITFEEPAPAAGVYRLWAVAETAADIPSVPAGPFEITIP